MSEEVNLYRVAEQESMRLNPDLAMRLADLLPAIIESLDRPGRHSGNFSKGTISGAYGMGNLMTFAGQGLQVSK